MGGPHLSSQECRRRVEQIHLQIICYKMFSGSILEIWPGEFPGWKVFAVRGGGWRSSWSVLTWGMSVFHHSNLLTILPVLSGTRCSLSQLDISWGLWTGASGVWCNVMSVSLPHMSSPGAQTNWRLCGRSQWLYSTVATGGPELIWRQAGLVVGPCHCTWSGPQSAGPVTGQNMTRSGQENVNIR